MRKASAPAAWFAVIAAAACGSASAGRGPISTATPVSSRTGERHPPSVVVVAPAPPVASAVPVVSPGPPVATGDQLVLDELDRVKAVLVNDEDAALVVARLGGPRQAPDGATIEIASPPVFAALEVESTSFEGAGLRVVVRLRAPIALGVLVTRGAVFERDPTATRDGRVTYVAEQIYPTRPFDITTEVTFPRGPREPVDLAAALVDTLIVVRRAPLGFH